MVLGIFSALAGLVKVRLSHTDIDSHIFRLHYRFTASALFVACAFVAANEYVGDPIQCLHNAASAPKVMNTYCWITTTFTINTTKNNGNIAGLGNHWNGTPKTFHAYYQWVHLVLFFQGCLFYLPHLLWKSVESKTAQILLQGLHRFTSDADLSQKKDNIIKYLKESRGYNKKYAVPFFVCEALNLVNVVGQIFLLDKFFGGSFLKYGVNVLGYVIEDSDDDPFREVFPKMTACTYRKIGPSGTQEVLHPLCILPQNILNEKVFVIFWFWFIILANVTALQLIWHIAVSFSPTVRVQALEKRGKMDSSHLMEKSIQRLHLGDYFLLDILGKNLDALTFKQVLMGAILDEDANANNGYNTLKPTEDDDDPVSMKRKMEMNEISDVTV